MIRRAVIMIGLLVWPLLGAWVGHGSGPELARINNVVAIARRNGNGNRIVQIQAAEITNRFTAGTTIFGAWCGLVVALQIAAILSRRAPHHYEVDPILCTTCGRCWTRCPIERKRVKRAGAPS